MAYQDGFNTTRDDGAECRLCGDDAVIAIERIQGERGPVPLCGKHADEQIAVCPGCDDTIWGKDGTRVYRSSNLYCPSCCAEHPVIASILDRALRADIARDDMQQVRR